MLLLQLSFLLGLDIPILKNHTIQTIVTFLLVVVLVVLVVLVILVLVLVLVLVVVSCQDALANISIEKLPDGKLTGGKWKGW